MVTSKPMFNPTLELPNVTAPISTSLHTNTMALTIAPLSRICIPCIKLIHPISMPQPLPILPSVLTSSCPTLDPITIISPINPIPFIPPIHKVIVHSTSIAPPFVKLTFIEITIAVKLHTFSYNLFETPLLFALPCFAHIRLTNEPLHRF